MASLIVDRELMVVLRIFKVFLIDVIFSSTAAFISRAFSASPLVTVITKLLPSKVTLPLVSTFFTVSFIN